jgi:hypothetical protein
MHNTSRARCIAAVLVCLTACDALAETPPACSRFSWNVRHELEIFAGPATQPGAAATATTPVRIGVDTLYALALQPHDRVGLVHAPGEPVSGDGGHAGLAGFRVARTGHYRVTVGSSLRIDIVGPDGLIDSAAFQAIPGCPLIYKIVEFLLPAGVDLVVQLSGSSSPRAQLAITRAPGA